MMGILGELTQNNGVSCVSMKGKSISLHHPDQTVPIRLQGELGRMN